MGMCFFDVTSNKYFLVSLHSGKKWIHQCAGVREFRVLSPGITRLLFYHFLRAHIRRKMPWKDFKNFFLPCQMQDLVFSVCLMWQSGEFLENPESDLPKAMAPRNFSSDSLHAATGSSSSPPLNFPYQFLVSEASLQVSHYQLQPSAFSSLSRIWGFKFALCLPFFHWSRRSHRSLVVQPFLAMRSDLFQQP